MRQLGQFKYLARDTATEIVAGWMQPSIRFSRAQCVDLPPTIYQTRHVELTIEQRVAYKSMVARLKMEFAGDQVRAVNEAVKRMKLVQIACGVVYGADGAEIVLPTKPRIEAVHEVIEEAGGKAIVFVPFKAALRYVAEELGKTHSVAIISGDVTAAARASIFHNFQKNHDPQVLVAQPAAMSHGLTLTAANTIVWYAPVDSNETYLQANARVTRPGQKLTQFIVHIEGTVVEQRIYERLKNKQKMQGILLESIQEPV